MDFDLTEEQSLLRDSLDRLLADRYGFEQRRKLLASPEGRSAEMWAQFAEMGLLALPFAEADGGLGGTAVEMSIVMESLGRALVLEPYFATVVLGGGLLRHAGSAAQREALVPAVAAGELMLAFAHTERASRFDLNHVETRAERDGDGFTLSGAKNVVPGGDAAGKVFVTARTAGGSRDEGGIGLFLVDTEAEGVSRRAYRNQDGQGAADFSFDRVRVGPDAVFGDPEGALPVVPRVADAAVAALCAEAIGVMSAMHAQTLDYLRVRKQFGVPIGAFQVLQHKAVDMYVAIEQARSIGLYATMMADSDDAEERSRAASAAKAEIGRAGKLVGENAIQIHGGVGMTMEYAVGHHFKRMTMIDLTLGDHRHHLRMLARAGGLFVAA